MCLQFMVEEMLRVRKRGTIRKPSDRAGKFKPKRQTGNNNVNMDFLTSDTGGGDGTDAGMAAIVGGTKRVSVTLSDLVRKVKAEDDLDNTLIDLSVLGLTKDQIDEMEDDEEENSFAAMAGY